MFCLNLLHRLHCVCPNILVIVWKGLKGSWHVYRLRSVQSARLPTPEPCHLFKPTMQRVSECPLQSYSTALYTKKPPLFSRC